MMLGNRDRAAWAGRFGVLALAIACALAPAWGAPAPASSDLRLDYRVDHWTTEDGLPQSTIIAMAQTPDGYLWLGTFSGLARFDGTRFKVFDPVNTPALRSGRIVAVCVDRHGTLWIFGEEGQVTRFRGTEFEAMNGREGVLSGHVSWTGLDPDGEVCINQTNMVFRHSPAGFVPVESVSRPGPGHFPGMSFTWPCTAWWNRDGRWASVSNAGLRRSFPELGEMALIPGAGGEAWMCATDQVRELRTGRVVKLDPPLPEATPLTTGAEDAEGNLWVGTWTRGVYRIDRAGRTRPLRLAPPGEEEAIRNVFRDLEGNIWVGTDVAGLFRVNRRAFRTYGLNEGLRGAIVKAVFEDRADRMWVLHQSGVDWILPDQGIVPGGLDRSLWSGGIAMDGRIWVGTFANGIFHYRDPEFVSCAVPEGSRLNTCRVIAEDRAGIIWLGTSSGLWQLAGTNAIPVALPASIHGHDVRAVTEDSGGALYVGLYDGGLLRRTGGKWEQFGKPEGLADDHVLTLLAVTNGPLWIGTTHGGLSRFHQGRFFNFTADKFPLPRGVSGIVADAHDCLWLGSGDGIYRVERSKLDAATAGGGLSTVRRYGLADGLGTRECASGESPTVWRSRDGRIWFATLNGVSVVDPARLPHNARPPPIVIQEVAIDSVPIRPGSTPTASAGAGAHPAPSNQERLPASLTVPPGNRRIDITYAALSLTASEKCRFRYRLEGLDTDWIEAGQRRTAYYQGLPPGQYGFRVTGCNNDGVWNENGALLAIVVRPEYWQTWWFRGALVAMVLGIVGGAARALELRKVRRRLELLERERAVNEERARIARDIHDDVGASLTQLTMLGEQARVAGGATGAANSVFPDVTTLSREAVRKLDELVWAVNPAHDTVSSLLDYLHFQMEEILQPAGIRARLDAPEDLPDEGISAETRREVLLAVKEAVNNAAKYSGAQEASLRITLKEHQLELVLQDNGRGFDPAAVGRLSHGLANMRHRMERLGGTLEIHSQPGHGTRLAFRLPIRPAPPVPVA